MINKIYFQRYGKFLIALVVLLFMNFVFSATNSVRSWHDTDDYYHSKDFKSDFEAYPEHYVYYLPDKNEGIPYKSVEEYIQSNSYVFSDMEEYSSTPTPDSAALKKMEEYHPKKNYFKTGYQDSSGFTALVLVALAGFLLFFADQKTAFNRFLFGLPVTRKELFRKKFLLVGGITLAALVLSQLLYCVIFYFGIPQPYMNVPFINLILSMLVCLGQQIFFFTASAFIGSMVGNLVFGPVTLVFFFWFSFLMTEAIKGFLSTLDAAGITTDLNINNLFVTIGKNQGYWFVPVILVLLACLLYFWSERKYQTLSLEYDGDFLLHKDSRWPVWGLMTFYTSFLGIFYATNAWEGYLRSQGTEYASSLSSAILTTLFMIAFCGTASFIVIFFSAIKARLRQWRERRNTRGLV